MPQAKITRPKSHAKSHDVRILENKQDLKLLPVQTPTEWRDERVILDQPEQEPSWKTQTSLGKQHGITTSLFQWFVGLLPEFHVREMVQYRYKTYEITEQAADFLVANRVFLEMIRANASRKKSLDSKQQAKDAIENASAQAGFTTDQLESKFKRLCELSNQGHLKLAAEMIASIEEKWIYEALLSGSSLNEEGVMTPGKLLKQFGKKSPLVLSVLVAFMPEETERHPSLTKDAMILIESDEIDEVASLVKGKLPGLKTKIPSYHRKGLSHATALLLAQQSGDLCLSGFANLEDEAAMALSDHCGDLALDSVEKLTPSAAHFLAKKKGDLALLSLKELAEDAARALAGFQGNLRLGIEELSESVAQILASCRGSLAFPSLKSLSAEAASALKSHSNTLILGDPRGFDDGCEIDLSSANQLRLHQGPLMILAIKKLSPKMAESFAACEHGLALPDLEKLPKGKAGIDLCLAMVRNPAITPLSLSLIDLNPECASALALLKGDLHLRVQDWSIESLTAISTHEGCLTIDPKRIDKEFAEALASRSVLSQLIISNWGTVSIAEGAAQHLVRFPGELVFYGGISISPEEAHHLTKRTSITIKRSNIKTAIRDIFDNAGSWTDETWKRKS
jgi:hypothetical protein